MNQSYLPSVWPFSVIIGYKMKLERHRVKNESRLRTKVNKEKVYNFLSLLYNKDKRKYLQIVKILNKIEFQVFLNGALFFSYTC